MDLLYFTSMIFTSVMSLSLALFFKSEIERKLNLSWRLFMIAFVVWSFGRAMMDISSQPQWALFWIRFAYCGSIWLAPLWTWMGYEVLKKKIPRSVFIVSLLVFAFFTVMNWTPHFISGVKPKLNFPFYDDNPGWAFSIWSIIFTAYAIWIHVVLILAIRKSNGLMKNRIRWILLAGILGFGGSASTFPLVNDIPMYPFAVPLVALSPLILTYAVVRFQLMDLYLLLRDTSVHLISSLVFAGPFVGLAGSISDHRLYAISMILMAGVIPLAYPQVSKFVRRNINRTRLGDVDRYLDDIEGKTTSLFSASFSISSLSSAALDLMTSIFPINEVSVYFMKTATKSLHLYARRGTQNEKIDISQNSDVFNLLTQIHDVVWKNDHQKQKLPQYQALEQFFVESKGEVLCPIFTTKQLTGLVVLGPKTSLSEYHAKDLNALKALILKLEIACAFAMASEKYAVVMGEWSHSLNQITKPMEQKAEVIIEFFDLYPPEKIKALASGILQRIHELRQFHDYITNTTAISRELITGEFKREIVDPGKIIRELSEGYKLGDEDKEVIVIDIPDVNARANINVGGLKRVVDELLGNALRHTRQKGSDARVIVSGRLGTSGFEVKVSDNGDGIDAGNINKIWDAGWQSKDMNSGVSGLGLSICRQIIEAHGGKVSASSPGKGQGMEISFIIPVIESTTLEKETGYV
ncbi:MAG: hypothetical protein JW893_08260 [Candidatus Omnitrophica bacterium]|nr:hypothetical protein [Candidatus Omnitrophota bacterium]